jgi:hypothetical protein
MDLTHAMIVQPEHIIIQLAAPPALIALRDIIVLAEVIKQLALLVNTVLQQRQRHLRLAHRVQLVHILLLAAPPALIALRDIIVLAEVIK